MATNKGIGLVLSDFKSRLRDIAKVSEKLEEEVRELWNDVASYKENLEEDTCPCGPGKVGTLFKDGEGMWRCPSCLGLVPENRMEVEG
jgi:hypothetical protein